MIRVGVLGAAGRMGVAVCRAVASCTDLSLVAAVDPGRAGEPLRDVAGVESELTVAGDVQALGESEVQVAVDFTVADSAAANMRWCAGHGAHAVVGTTGIGADTVAELAVAFERGGVNCVMTANFAIGAVLMMRFAELAAPFMDGVEIVELHHDAKRDAPSGTALRTAERMEVARAGSEWAADPTTDTVVAGARGGSGPGGIHIHSVRLPGLVAHQEVILGAEGQSLTLRHDAYDRTSFMPGVLLAVRKVADTPGFTTSLDALLGF